MSAMYPVCSSATRNLVNILDIGSSPLTSRAVRHDLQHFLFEYSFAIVPRRAPFGLYLFGMSVRPIPGLPLGHPDASDQNCELAMPSLVRSSAVATIPEVRIARPQ